MLKHWQPRSSPMHGLKVVTESALRGAYVTPLPLLIRSMYKALLRSSTPLLRWNTTRKEREDEGMD